MRNTRIDSVELKWTEDEHGLSCVAVAEASYPISGDSRFGEDRRLEWLSSCGLHGIDSQSDPAYRREIELDELANLQGHLEHFGLFYTMADLKALSRLTN
jgi:hypothetical protein